MGNTKWKEVKRLGRARWARSASGGDLLWVTASPLRLNDWPEVRTSQDSDKNILKSAAETCQMWGRSVCLWAAWNLCLRTTKDQAVTYLDSASLVHFSQRSPVNHQLRALVLMMWSREKKAREESNDPYRCCILAQKELKQNTKHQPANICSHNDRFSQYFSFKPKAFNLMMWRQIQTNMDDKSHESEQLSFPPVEMVQWVISRLREK